jgi:hypothetical protein
VVLEATGRELHAVPFLPTDAIGHEVNIRSPHHATSNSCDDTSR